MKGRALGFRDRRKAQKGAERRRRWLRGAFGLVLALGLVGIGDWGLQMLLSAEVFPIRVVKIEGGLKNTQRHLLQEAIAEEIGEGFFSLDLDSLRLAAEKLAWVDRAVARRVWPDAVEVQVVERVAFARWGEASLVTHSGEVFTPEDGRLPEKLPRFSGEGTEPGEIVEAYEVMGQMLRPIGLSLVRVERDARGAWEVEGSSGLVLALGTENRGERLRRFVRLYPALVAAREDADPIRVDLRYANGFAVLWRERPESEPPEAKRSAKRAVVG